MLQSRGWVECNLKLVNSKTWMQCNVIFQPFLKRPCWLQDEIHTYIWHNTGNVYSEKGFEDIMVATKCFFTWRNQRKPGGILFLMLGGLRLYDEAVGGRLIKLTLRRRKRRWLRKRKKVLKRLRSIPFLILVGSWKGFPRVGTTPMALKSKSWFQLWGFGKTWCCSGSSLLIRHLLSCGCCSFLWKRLKDLKHLKLNLNKNVDRKKQFILLVYQFVSSVFKTTCYVTQKNI